MATGEVVPAAGPQYGVLSSSFVVERAATAPNIKRDADSWLERCHPEYKKNCEKYALAHDFYTGDPGDGATMAQKYLIRRYQGESDQAFIERQKTADFTPWLGTLVDTLAGMLFAVEDKTSRVWAGNEKQSRGATVGGLGDPADPESVAYRLVRDSDGRGTSWKTTWRKFAIKLILYQKYWVLIDTVNKRPVVKLVEPMAVPNWVDSPNGPIEVLMKEKPQQVYSLQDDYSKVPSYIRWHTKGWERWTVDEEGHPIRAEGEGTYKYVDRNGEPTLPIYPIKLPMSRHVAALLAGKASVLFNQESVRDFSLRCANFGKLIIGIDAVDQYEQLLDQMLKGANVLPESANAKGAHRYIAPQPYPIKIASEVLEKKRDEFWANGFKMYGDAIKGQERTATEVKQDIAAGVGAFLQLLAASVDDAENGAFWRLGQAEFKDTPARWGQAYVERADDFSSADLATMLDEMRKRYYGETDTTPIGRSALIQLAKDSAQQDGLPVKDDEIEAAVDSQMLLKYGNNLSLLNVTPPLVKARLAMRLVAALGLVKAEEVIKLSEGEEQKLFDILLTEAEELAIKADQAQARMAEMPAIDDEKPAEDGGKPKPKSPSVTKAKPTPKE